MLPGHDSGDTRPAVVHFLMPLLFVGSGHSATPCTLVATVERVNDGATIAAVSAGETKLRICLVGIDTPEIAHGTKPGQPLATKIEAIWTT